MQGKLGQYEVLDVVGMGPYSVCRKILRKRDKKLLMWKEIDYSTIPEIGLQRLHARTQSLKSLRHENIMRYHDMVIERTTAYIITEYCHGDSVSTIIRLGRRENQYLEEETVWLILNQLLMAFQECHSTANHQYLILHQNLKPTNVFLHRGKAKLGDFAYPMPVVYNKENSMSDIPESHYSAPEQHFQGRYSSKSDIWAMGCLIYEICSFIPPSFGNKFDDLGHMKRLPPIYSQNLKMIINLMLTIKEDDRPTAAEIMQKTFLSMNIEGPLMQKETQNLSGLFMRGDGSNEREITWREMKLKHMEEHLYKREKRIEKLEKKLAKSRRVLREKLITVQTVSDDKQKQNTLTLPSMSSASILPSPSKKKKHVHFQLHPLPPDPRYAWNNNENNLVAGFRNQVQEWEKKLQSATIQASRLRAAEFVYTGSKPAIDVVCKHLATL